MRRRFVGFLAGFVLVLAVVYPIGTLFGQTEQAILPNLYPRMSDFSISQETFTPEDDSVLDECIEPGEHRLLRFTISVANSNGAGDAYIGNPEDNPALFVWSATHGHYHVARFNEYRLLDAFGHEVAKGFKQGFCMIDIEPLTPRNPASSTGYDCENQGISAGWADVYDASLPCQFVELKNFSDGRYILEVRTNAHYVITETTYGDNVARVRLSITGDDVRPIP
ncbi:MAG: lysyl oxidase family protein [Anaerolineae bacterium]